MKILIGNDHRGFHLKCKIIKKLVQRTTLSKNTSDFTLEDIGCNSTNRCDYPDIINKLVINEFDFGVLICHTGIGMSICANKYQQIRAALCVNVEMAKLSREHNNCNVIVLPAAYISAIIAIKMINTFINTAFSKEDIYKKRLEKFPKLL